MDDATTPGIDAGAVTAWFEAHAPGVVPPLHFRLIAGGRSNLTFEVTDEADGRWVLRRPPLSNVLATAHDMSREHRIITALADTNVPVAPAIGLCTDEAVNEAPFYVMEFVDGTVVRDASVAQHLSLAQRAAAGQSVAETLARIHAVDPDAVGLGTLGRKEGYVARQLKRWNGQFEQSRTREVPEVTQAYDRLVAAIPEQGAPAIVHGDYRLDNCMVDDAGQVVAVLDWELCTLGDPLADLGVLMVYWASKDDPFAALPSAATTLDGFPNRTELVAAYEAASGREVGNIDYYVAFGYWKLACILEGVYARYKAGSMGDDGADSDAFGDTVRVLGQASLAALDRPGG
ncbi:MAG: phosphotransferase family protein [Acidimicrobiales bacterium]